MEWVGGKLVESPHGVFHLLGVDLGIRQSVIACEIEPPVFPVFLPKFEDDLLHGEGMLITEYSFARQRAYWGQFGAAGIAVRRPRVSGEYEYLLGRRANVHRGNGEWAFFGGAHDSFEHSLEPYLTAIKELEEEAGISLTLDGEQARLTARLTFDRDPHWRYDTFIADISPDLAPSLNVVLNWEHSDANWFSVQELLELQAADELFTPVAKSLRRLLSLAGELIE